MSDIFYGTAFHRSKKSRLFLFKLFWSMSMVLWCLWCGVPSVTTSAAFDKRRRGCDLSFMWFMWFVFYVSYSSLMLNGVFLRLAIIIIVQHFWTDGLLYFLSLLDSYFILGHPKKVFRKLDHFEVWGFLYCALNDVKWNENFAIFWWFFSVFCLYITTVSCGFSYTLYFWFNCRVTCFQIYINKTFCKIGEKGNFLWHSRRSYFRLLNTEPKSPISPSFPKHYFFGWPLIIIFIIKCRMVPIFPVDWGSENLKKKRFKTIYNPLVSEQARKFEATHNNEPDVFPLKANWLWMKN